jgi:hypothetical protein
MYFVGAKLRGGAADSSEVHAFMRRSSSTNSQQLALPPPFALDEQITLAFCNWWALHERVNERPAVVQ